MPDSPTQRIIQAGAAILGAIFYVFIVFYDAVALLINNLKMRLRLAQLTDFRRQEEEALYIPPLTTIRKEKIELFRALSQTEAAIIFTIPLIDSNPNDVLLEVRIDSKTEVSTDIELCLSGTEKGAKSESIFLFLNPFNTNADLRYPSALLWFTIPMNRTLELTCVDIRPTLQPFHLSSIKITVIDWR